MICCILSDKPLLQPTLTPVNCTCRNIYGWNLNQKQILLFLKDKCSWQMSPWCNVWSCLLWPQSVNTLGLRQNSRHFADNVFRCIFTRGQFWPSGIVVACVCVCVCVSVRMCVNHLLVRAITRDLFKLGSPNLDQRCKRPWLRSLLFWGAIDLDLQGQI